MSLIFFRNGRDFDLLSLQQSWLRDSLVCGHRDDDREVRWPFLSNPQSAVAERTVLMKQESEYLPLLG